MSSGSSTQSGLALLAVVTLFVGIIATSACQPRREQRCGSVMVRTADAPQGDSFTAGPYLVEERGGGTISIREVSGGAMWTIHSVTKWGCFTD